MAELDTGKLTLEYVTDQNSDLLRAIQRDDVSEDFVDTVDTLLDITRYGTAHGCIGHTYAIRYDDQCIGMALLGEALPWETDPVEMSREPFYRLMGFLIDQRYRGRGIGSYVLEEIIRQCYREFGVRPIALGVHRDNHGAERFYLRHGFCKTTVMEGNDFYYLRYPAEQAQ